MQCDSTVSHKLETLNLHLWPCNNKYSHMTSGATQVDKLKTIKFDVVEEGPATKYIRINLPNRLKRLQKLHPLKSQSIFSEASRTEWRKPFDFPT